MTKDRSDDADFTILDVPSTMDNSRRGPPANFLGGRAAAAPNRPRPVPPTGAEEAATAVRDVPLRTRISPARLAQLAPVAVLILGPAAAYLLSPEIGAAGARALALLRAGDAEALRRYVLSYGLWAPVVSVLLMVAQAIAAPFPHFLVVFANGLAFGVWWGWAVSMVGQLVAAAVCFGLARALGWGAVERLVGRFGLVAADRWFGRWGVLGVAAARLLPGIAFDGLSYGAGLTGIRFWPFMAATAVGSAPQALLYVYLGRNAAGSAWWLLALTAVLAAAGLFAQWRRRRTAGRPPAPLRTNPGGSRVSSREPS